MGLVLIRREYHRLGKRKSKAHNFRYWDLSYNNYNYSYTDVAVDQYGYSTLAIDRLGVGQSSHPDPLNVVQAPTELATIYGITQMLRAGKITALNGTRASKIVHVGHSFGSILSYELAAAYPTASDGLILTGFSANGTWLPQTIAAWNLQIASQNQPFRFGNLSLAAIDPILELYGLVDLVAGLALSFSEIVLPNGYLTWGDLGANIFAFLTPSYYDPAIGPYTEQGKYPVTYGEILTIGSQPGPAPEFTGPVQVITGNEDAIFCGSNCSATGGASASVLSSAGSLFPKASVFEAYVQPRTGHALNVHYNSTGAFNVIQKFLISNGLAATGNGTTGTHY
jgi:pimeloyl-ACP methyl ester carboxylesterase